MVTRFGISRIFIVEFWCLCLRELRRAVLTPSRSCSQTRVINAIYISSLIALPCFVVIADPSKVFFARKDDLVRLLDVLHPEAFANVPSDMAMLF